GRLSTSGASVPDGGLQERRGGGAEPTTQLDRRRRSVAGDAAALVYGLSAAMGSTGFLGDHRWDEHRQRRAARRRRDPIHPARWQRDRARHADPVLRAALFLPATAGDRALLVPHVAREERWRV